MPTKYIRATCGALQLSKGHSPCVVTLCALEVADKPLFSSRIRDFFL